MEKNFPSSGLRGFPYTGRFGYCAAKNRAQHEKSLKKPEN
jgi:hypothetical protein